MLDSKEKLSRQEIADYAMRSHFPLTPEKEESIRRRIDLDPNAQAELQVMLDRKTGLDRLTPSENHFARLQQKTTPSVKSNLTKTVWLRAAAIFLIIVGSYSGLVAYVNYRFDHGPQGLAQFQKDYEFAIAPAATRGSNEKEPEDIRLFKEGVRLLFESKETTLGLFPRYDKEKLVLTLNTLESVRKLTTNSKVFLRVEILTAQINKYISE
ncbi:hypothetical protein L6Q79_09195 [bacterium]|nr:hypothetical protein [bacterium]NUN45183.1 hypothetical protein [bacterium]